jgi:tRNA(fMet)-specific endonuclease VapC
MIYLLDANAISDLMREHPQVLQRAQILQPANKVITCTIAWGEILYGIERLADGARKRELVAKSIELSRVLPVWAAVSEAAPHYARLKHERNRVGKSLDDNDLWIAATALALGAILVTRDTDFWGTPGLAVEDWTK